MDAIKQYSYYVFGNQQTPDGLSMQTVEGTCFFVRANDKTYLISAKHLMTSWSTSDAEKPALYPDTLFIRLPAADSNGYTDYPVDIRQIKAHIQGSYYYAAPDIFVALFPDAGNFPINTLTDIAAQNIPTDLSAAAIVYGFPARITDRGKYRLAKQASLLEGRLYSSPRQNISYRDNKRNTPVSDSINYLIKLSTAVQGGYSGAPVFLRNDGADNWYFAGIVSQGVPNDNYFFVVKPTFLEQEISRQQAIAPE